MTRASTLLGILLPPVYITAGLFIPASDALRAVAVAVTIASGALIGRWWAATPTVLTFVALGLLEEANYRGFGPGARIGTVTELHTGEFSPQFALFMIAVAAALPTIGVLARHVVWRIAGRSHR